MVERLIHKGPAAAGRLWRCVEDTAQLLSASANSSERSLLESFARAVLPSVLACCGVQRGDAASTDSVVPAATGATDPPDANTARRLAHILCLLLPLLDESTCAFFEVHSNLRLALLFVLLPGNSSVPKRLRDSSSLVYHRFAMCSIYLVCLTPIYNLDAVLVQLFSMFIWRL